MREELEPFLEASRNNTTYIRKWLADHPLQSDIDKEWAGVNICPVHGNNDQALGTPNDRRGNGLKLVLSLVTLGLLVGFPPAGVVSGVGLLGLCGAQEVNACENEWLKKRKNWTMLEFAIGEGASDVAVILILKGATMTTFFDGLLESRKSKYPQLFQACCEAKQKQTAMKNLKSELTTLKKQIQEGKDLIDKLKTDLTKAQTQQQTPAVIPGAAVQAVNLGPQLAQLQAQNVQLQKDLDHLKKRKNHYKNNYALFSEKILGTFSNQCGAGFTPKAGPN